ncbi:hypothetical protein Pan44_11450 [Caulifigura coniformis]|uniref:HEAT repeat protein n=1 Tax=Caulifigura coniformis TaxID=2527983 RepID=A0A517SAH2_9PLAN|nr:hypothetical protein [Caulifigura coniformis]QDT53130.1 hypothetical protein Pan44_11450 [Caulifigura coniformis]
MRRFGFGLGVSAIPLVMLAFAVAADRRPVATTAAELLDDARSADVRNAVIEANPDRAGAIVAEMAKGIGNDPAEEYRRIPWIWRVAVAAGKRNDAAQLKALMEASLPQDGERLRDWQAVVIGGGVINGITLAGAWPGPRIEQIIGSDEALRRRWKWAIQKSAGLADDESVTRGTRYDALRMIAFLGWDNCGAKLRNYLSRGTHAELQMGAVSACGDMDDVRAAEALIAALPGLDARNVRLAVNALKRTAERKQMLDEAVAAGRVSAELLNAK